MKKQFAQLTEAYYTKQLVRLKRVSERGGHWDGFVVGLSNAFVLFHALDEYTMTLNGYMTLPLYEVRKVLVLDDSYLTPRVVDLKNLQPVPQPDILLVDLPGVLSSVNTHFPLMGLDVEPEPGFRYIGRVSALKKNSVTLKKISREVKWVATQKFKFSDITCVSFGGGYEEALWMVAENERRIAALLESETEE